MSAIEWTDATWNPVTGCDAISPGCDNCYAERMSKRLQAMGNPRYANGFDVTLHEDKVDDPLKWRKPRRVFVNSMSDLFHPSVPYEFASKVFDVMSLASRHTYQVLTKRPKSMARFVDTQGVEPQPHIWLGTSIEDRERLYRLDQLRSVNAAVRFLSLEPLLEGLGDVDLSGVHWVIVGGESGPGARRIEGDWVRDIRDQCVSQGVPFFFKQWGGVNKKATGRVLDGVVWDEYPDLSHRQFQGI